MSKQKGYPYEPLNSIDDYRKPLNNFLLKKEDFFSKLKSKCLIDEETERTEELNKLFDFEIGEELSKLY